MQLIAATQMKADDVAFGISCSAEKRLDDQGKKRWHQMCGERAKGPTAELGVFGKIYGDGETDVQFILGVVLFVVVVGLVDARIPWPKPQSVWARRDRRALSFCCCRQKP